MKIILIGFIATLLVAAAFTVYADPTGLKTEHFDKDPGWDALNNRVLPAHGRMVTQDFGFQDGELGGHITRAAKPAYYAAALEGAGKTLDDKLSASGTFSLTHTSGGAGMFFGWFNSSQPGGGGRAISSLGMDFDGENPGARLAVRMISRANKSCGTFITPFIPGKFRPTPIKNDGTKYTWKLEYDPNASGGDGQFEFSIKSDSKQPEEFEGKVFAVNLPKGFRKEGATFDRFGLLNLMKPGGTMTAHFDDLQFDGRHEDFSKEPAGWISSGNHETYEEHYAVGSHNFGFTATNIANGEKPGEIGGDLWRGGKYGFYADKVGPFSMDDRLEARGKVTFVVGAPDADMYFGWFDGEQKEHSPVDTGNFLGVHVGGPTRVGHYFQPALTTAKGNRPKPDGGPLPLPGKSYDWSLVYNPTDEGGNGSIKVTLGEESFTLALKKGLKAEGAHFNHFGLLTSEVGGSLVRIYFDDLTYTASPAR